MIDVFSQLVLKEMILGKVGRICLLTLQQRKKYGRKGSEESLHLEQTNSNSNGELSKTTGGKYTSYF